MKDIQIINNQSLFDIAIEQLGNVDKVFELALLNGISLTNDLYPGQNIMLPKSDTSDVDIQNYFSNKKIATATTFPIEGELTPILEGIDYMAIEQDFTVQ